MTEEQKDELLSLSEDMLDELDSEAGVLDKMQSDALVDFEMKAVALKNKIATDPTISDDDLEGAYVAGLEELRREVVAKMEQTVSDRLRNQEESH